MKRSRNWILALSMLAVLPVGGAFANELDLTEFGFDQREITTKGLRVVKVVNQSLGCHGGNGVNDQPPCETATQLSWLPEELIEDLELRDGELTGQLTGSLRMFIVEDRDGNESAFFDARINGMPNHYVPSIWVTYCNPRDRIRVDTDGGPPLFGFQDTPESTFCSRTLLAPFPLADASVDPNVRINTVPGRPSVPLQSLFTGPVDGIGRGEGNRPRRIGNERWRLAGRLEWNPLKPFQGPVANSVEVNQAVRNPLDVIPDLDGDSVDYDVEDMTQDECCFGGPPGFSTLQPVSGSYLRIFDKSTDNSSGIVSGYQVLDERQIPKLVKSPLPAWIFTLIVHTDETTHGVHSGGPGGGAALLGMFLLCDPDDVDAEHPNGAPFCM